MFAHQNAPPAKSAHKPRCGVIEAEIGSKHMVRCGDGIIRGFTVREKSRHPNAKHVALSLTKRQAYASKDELLADNPPHGIMLKQEDVNLWAFFSDEPIDPSEKVEKGKPIDYAKVIGLMSEAYPSQR